MIVKPVERDDDKPFVQITLIRKEAEILKKLLRLDIETIRSVSGEHLITEQGSNAYFGLPLFIKLNDLLNK